MKSRGFFYVTTGNTIVGGRILLRVLPASPVFSLPRPRDFTLPACRRGTLYLYMTMFLRDRYVFGHLLFFVSASVWDSLRRKPLDKSLRLTAVFRGRLQRPSTCLIRSARRSTRGLGVSARSCKIIAYEEVLSRLRLYLAVCSA